MKICDDLIYVYIVKESHNQVNQHLLQHIFTFFVRTQILLSSVQFSSVAQSCPTPCDLMNCSTPGLPVQTHTKSKPTNSTTTTTNKQRQKRQKEHSWP